MQRFKNVRFLIDFRDRKPVGRTGEKVSAIGIGTWAIRDYGAAENVLVEAVELGIDLIDTAEMYGEGKAEEMVSRVVTRVGREAVFITTKMLPHHLRWRDEVVKAAKASLKRLGVSEVDLFLIHWPNPSLSIEKQIKNFEAIIDEGLARYIGVSNFDAEEMKEAVQAARKAEIVVNQVHYSVLHKREVENSILPTAIHLGISVQAYTPLERGAVVDDPVVKSVANELGKTPVQVALNYLISRPNVFAIPKTENKEHLREIFGSLGWRIPPELMSRIERA